MVGMRALLSDLVWEIRHVTGISYVVQDQLSRSLNVTFICDRDGL